MAIDSLEILKTKKPMAPKHTTTLAIVAMVIGIVVFLSAYLSMSLHIGLDRLNQPILTWIFSHRIENLTTIAKIITNLGTALSIVIITTVIVIVWLIAKRETLRPLLLIISMAFAAVTSLVMKALIMGVRPPQADMIPTFEIDYSFPSGHTLAAVVFLLVLGYLLYSRYFSKPKMIAWLIIALVGSGIIAATRLYLGYHWLTDVVASIGLGLIILAIIITLDKLISSRTRLN